MRTTNLSLLPLSAVLVVAMGLTACGQKTDDATVGQKMDSAVEKMEQKTDSTMAKVEQKTDAVVGKVEQKTEQIVDATSAKVKDAAITTSINAELAKDSSLSALKINVDTSGGRVALKGSAPDSASRDRATQLAQRVDGVVGVDNQLEIRTN